jgi:non-ribosomal peptide synthetase component F
MVTRKRRPRVGQLVAGLVIVGVALVVILLAMRGAGAGYALRPLPQEERASFLKYDPGLAQWIDQLNAVYTSLPSQAKKQMMAQGEYSFRLADLPKEQADTIRGLIRQDMNGSYSWASFQIGSPPDLSVLTFKFGRIPEDPAHVRFMIQAPNGNRMQPEIGLWPQG